MRLIIVNGFLGSGKTTFIKDFIRNQPGVPVIVNEFGSSTYDKDQLDHQGNPIHLIQHGSIFCTCKAVDFVAVLSALMNQDQQLILVESSGFADPSGMDQLIQQALTNTKFEQAEVCALSIADPLTLMKLIGSMAMLRRQIEVADTILINKTDLEEASKIVTLEKSLRLMNPKATIVQGSFGKIDPVYLKSHPVSQKESYHAAVKKDLYNSELCVALQPWSDLAALNAFLREIEPHILRLKGSTRTSADVYRIEIAGGLISVVPSEHGDDTLALLYSARQTSARELLEILRKYQPDFERRP